MAAKATTIKDAIKIFEEKTGQVATEAEKVRDGRAGHLASGMADCMACMQAAAEAMGDARAYVPLTASSTLPMRRAHR